jgi:hypothetical protein
VSSVHSYTIVALIRDDSHLQFSKTEYSNLQFSIFENRNSHPMNSQFSKIQFIKLLAKNVHALNVVLENVTYKKSAPVISEPEKVSLLITSF